MATASAPFSVSLETEMQLHEYILSHVLGFCPVGERTQRESVHRALVDA